MPVAKNWRRILISPSTPILQALEVIDRGTLRMALVVDDSQHLLGVVTDGDIRRGLLRRLSLDEMVTRVMCDHPVVAGSTESRASILARMRTHDIYHIPVVDRDGRIIRLDTLQELAQPGPRPNWVVLMAGGLGSRLGELTQFCPKPLLQVGTQPILEIILESFIAHGFNRFFLSVNYKKEMIRHHFGDGSRWGVTIDYLEENGRLGTAASLALLPQRPEHPFFVMNGDLLTKIDFSRIVDFHQEHHSQATLCVRKVEQSIPYGVVEVDQDRLLDIVEKPVREYFVNAGIYLLEPEVLDHIASDHPLDMPDLFRQLIQRQFRTTAFPFLEYWLDIGRLGDFQQACRDYPEIFP